jgi:hypothetical protein
MVIVEKLVEWRFAAKTEVPGENLPQRHFLHHKFHMTRPGRRGEKFSSCYFLPLTNKYSFQPPSIYVFP